MEVPTAVLEKLVCVKCAGYLSRGPVLSLDNGKNLCGRCVIEKDNGTRNTPYEELASLMKFPCSYEKYGCKQRVLFEENERHEKFCVYRSFVCPFADSKYCAWIGVQGELLKHCQLEHPDNVEQNPVKLTHDIARNSCKNYLVSAFQVLFLIQTRVCVTTKSVSHSVKFIGNSNRAAKYTFHLDVENEGGKICRRRLVAPQGLTDLQMDSWIVTEVDILQRVLGSYQGTTFTVTLQTTNGATLEEIEDDMRKLAMQVGCVACQYKTAPVWRDDKGWRCSHCAPERRSCKNSAKGCEYFDTNIKNKKHKNFCAYTSRCIICRAYITESSLETHYSQTHLDITQNSGTIWNTAISNEPKWRIITADFGRALCHYWVYGSKFFMYIRVPLPSDQLYLYKCLVEISHPVTGRTMTWTASPQHFYTWDFELTTPDENVYRYVYSRKFHVNIDFIKIFNNTVALD